MKQKLIKILPLFLLGLLSLNTTAVAEKLTASQVSISASGIHHPSGSQEPEARFNIDFPGGTPRELIAALNEASGTPVNAFIPETVHAFTMPPMKYYNVSVSEVLKPLQGRQVINVAEERGSRESDIQEISYRWSSSDNIWRMEVQDIYPSPPTQFIVAPFNVSHLLEAYTIDDITTTIDSAWKLNRAPKENEIMFHPETKIILVKCPAEDMQVLSSVLDTLRVALIEASKAPKVSGRID
jgi:hypothetical protein